MIDANAMINNALGNLLSVVQGVHRAGAALVLVEFGDVFHSFHSQDIAHSSPPRIVNSWNGKEPASWCQLSYDEHGAFVGRVTLKDIIETSLDQDIAEKRQKSLVQGANMPKKKPDARLERRLTRALTDACEQAKPLLPGFVWLTHLVDEHNIPGSLRVIWVFKTQDDMTSALKGDGWQHMRVFTEAALLEVGVAIGKVDGCLDADNEEDCLRVHGGDWQKRLSTRGRH